MHRLLLPCLVCILLGGCGERDAPMLHLTVKRDNGATSVSRFRVFSTGRIAESGDHGDDGSGMGQRITVDRIEDHGVTLTITLSIKSPGAPVEESAQQVFIPYGEDTTVAQLKDATLIGRLERKK